MSSHTSSEFGLKYGPWGVVLGASEGIGAAFANGLAARGINVVMVARRLEPLTAEASRISEQHGVQTRLLSLDLAREDFISSLDTATQDLELGIVVYNACYSAIGSFVEQDESDHQTTIMVNCMGPLKVSSWLAPRLSERGRGGLILVSSMAGFQGSAMVASYAASKAFDTVLAEGLWRELRPHGVDAMACVAGATSTPNFLEATPIKGQKIARPMKPDDVAEGALNALGSGPTYIAGGLNKTVHAVTSRLLNRKQAVSFFSRSTEAIYGQGALSGEGN